MSDERYARLLDRLRELGPAAVAFSGGADSTLLAAAVRDCFGDRAMALTVAAPQMANWETAEAEDLAAGLGIRHRLVTLPLLHTVRDNPPQRCYLCKRALFTELIRIAAHEGFRQVVDGTNYDDLGQYRPGLKALRELGIRSPLAECGLTKSDVRALSRELGLPTWDKPAYACLLTRLPHGTRVTEDMLQRIEAAECHLIDQGFRSVRVRVHGELARIEVESSQQSRLLAQAAEVSALFLGLGFRHVTLDLGGYRCGSMDEPTQ